MTKKQLSEKQKIILKDAIAIGKEVQQSLDKINQILTELERE